MAADQARPSGEHTDQAEASGGTAEDTKRKFREALERKQAKAAGRGGLGEAGDQGKIHGSHGPESNQKSFRRKSGG